MHFLIIIISFLLITITNCDIIFQSKLSFKNKVFFSRRSYDRIIYGLKVNHSNEETYKSMSNRGLNEIEFKIDNTNEKSFDVNNSAKYIDASSQIKPFAIVILSLLYGSISFVCIAGNGLVIYSVTKNKKIKTVTKYFINNLAISDMIIGVFVNPFQVSIYLTFK